MSLGLTVRKSANINNFLSFFFGAMSRCRLWPPSRLAVISGLQISWVLVVLWYEVGIFNWTSYTCYWPDSGQPRIPNSRIVRILVIADPQVLDRHSYPERGTLLSTLSRAIVDLNLRRSWRATFHTLRPDAVVVLGDMMDNGRLLMSTHEYEAYYERYRDIYNMDEHVVPTYYLPGNHDIGLGDASVFSPEAHSRYTSHFGPRNHRTSIGNYTLVFIDAPALAEEDVLRADRGHTFETWPAVRRGPVEFVKQTAESKPEGPVILFTHIPLARPPDADCGPLRERGTVRQGFGFGYQNTLMDGATEFLLDRLRPWLILSGDDHDYCDYQHTMPSSNKKVREVTVKSFSMAMGIRRPGFQLLSLVSTVPVGDSLTQTPTPLPLDAPCLLPDQIGIYLNIYVPLIIISLIILFVLSIFCTRPPAPGSKHARRSRQSDSHELSRLSRDRYDTHSSGDHYNEYSLPLQAPITESQDDLHLSTKPRGRSWSSSSWTCTFKLGHRRRRIVLPSLLCKRRPLLDSQGAYPHEASVLRAFGRNVLAVASPPVFVFLLAAWWTMHQ